MQNEADFMFVSKEVRARSGLVLTPDKAYLLEARLGPIARRENFSTVADFMRAIRQRPDEQLLWQITDALTTNETFFFRDKTPFDLLRGTILPEMERRRGGGRVRFWCAAASTGQEPYSIAMVLDEARAMGRGVDCEIVATDISERVLEKARAGQYSQFEVQRGLPIQLLMKHFEKSGDLWRISDRLRAMVRFQRYNLLDDLRPLGRFDVVFCRNVLIYFEPDVKRQVLEKIAAAMPDDGYLILGGAETVIGVTEAFSPLPGHHGLYMRNSTWRKVA